jgi:hypothetical protein
MTSLVLHQIGGGKPFDVEFSEDKPIKTNDLKEYISDLYGVDSVEVKLFIRYSKNNQLLEKKDGEFFEGSYNRYLFSLDPFYEPEKSEIDGTEDSIDNLINYASISPVGKIDNNIFFSTRKIRK